MNWLDIVLGSIIGLSVITGFNRGLVRIGIGFAAVITGFLLSSWNYGIAAPWFLPYVSSRSIADLLGFLTIFLGIIILGAVVASLIGRILKLTGLSWLDRLLGGAFGVVRGLLICVIVVMIITAFSPVTPPRSVVTSVGAPYILAAADVLAAATPHDLKGRFRKSYGQIKGMWEGSVTKRSRIPVERY